MESDDQQLPLNDIYNWFRDKSSYFRTNSVTWKVLFNSTVLIFAFEICFSRMPSDTICHFTNISYECRPTRAPRGWLTKRNLWNANIENPGTPSTVANHLQIVPGAPARGILSSYYGTYLDFHYKSLVSNKNVLCRLEDNPYREDSESQDAPEDLSMSKWGFFCKMWS